MSRWILHPTILENPQVKLIPLETEHYDDLIAIAQDPRIWEFYAFNGTNPTSLTQALDDFKAGRDTGTTYPFVIIDKAKDKIVGCTSYTTIYAKYKKLEIGFTWILPEYWKTGFNRICKDLLLEYAFDQLGAVRVQFKTDVRNIRSQKAIQKLGAKFEGVLRNDMLREDLSYRDSAYYSIIVQEWQEMKSEKSQTKSEELV